MKFIIKYQKKKLKGQIKIMKAEQALKISMWFPRRYTKWIFNSSKCLIIRVVHHSAMELLIHKTNMLVPIRNFTIIKITRVIKETGPGNVCSQRSHSRNQLRNWASLKNLAKGSNLAIET